MKLGKQGIELIKSFEGCKLKVYLDAVGLPTIGYGHLIKPGESFTKITQKEAEDLLKSDAQIFVDGVNKLLEVNVTQNQFDALVSIAFNIGLGNLKSSTLLRLVNAGDYKGAADQFPRWNKAGGKVLNGLTKRRNAERDLFMGK
jgi:lysozyme